MNTITKCECGGAIFAINHNSSECNVCGAAYISATFEESKTISLSAN